MVQNSNIVLYPTDTVYGLGVDSTDPEAVLRLIELKGRDEKKPISIVVSDMEMAGKYADVTPLAEKLAKKFLPGKITLVLSARAGLAPQISAGTGTVGIRIPNHTVPRKLVHDLGKPITATSANVADMPTLHMPSEILNQFAERAAMITKVIDEGELPMSLPSTVVDARGDIPVILRDGAIASKEILSQNG